VFQKTVLTLLLLSHFRCPIFINFDSDTLKEIFSKKYGYFDCDLEWLLKVIQFTMSCSKSCLRIVKRKFNKKSRENIVV